MPVLCGRGEFPTQCGPGSRCGNDGCVPDAGCARIVCDASNFCRGADCPAVGGGGVHGITLDPIADATAGTPKGVAVRATVTADGLCGLSVTFELRKEIQLYVSAYNDHRIWLVPFMGTPSLFVAESESIGGLTSDRSGTLYYTLQNTGVIRRVPITAGAPMPETFGSVPAQAFLNRLARLTFGPDGLLYAVQEKKVYRFAPDGTVTQTWDLPDSTFLTGIVFDRDGSLLAAQHWPKVWRLSPGAAAFVTYLDATSTVPANTVDPWNEGMALGPDGLVYVGVFPTGNKEGIVYRVDAQRMPHRLIGLAEMARDVPAVQYAGVHGLAFGADGSLYFVNQNTSGATQEPRGQVLVQRTNGKIELVASGFNFDWPNGFDGDIVAAQGTVQSISALVDAMGHAAGALDAPAMPGNYGVRALVTDPRTGAISEARGTVRVR
jgi:sugar lactone lactonase YvrE